MREGMNRQDYINAILEQIDSKTVRAEIEKELSAHIDDREEYYREIGYGSETAAEKAVERMGSPEAAADGFNKVHKKYRLVFAILAVIMSGFVVLYFWFWAIAADSQSTMGLGITEALILMYIIGLSVLGKRRNSRFICFTAVIDFFLTYGIYFLYKINDGSIDEFCSRIVLKLTCLLTFDFECLSAFWLVGRITVAPYLIYLSAAFYTAVFITLVLVFISVCMLKKPTYGLREKHFACKAFKSQKVIWFFIAATIFILPIDHFDEKADVTLKEPQNFNAVVIAQSDTPCPISEIPPKDIYVAVADWSLFPEPFEDGETYMDTMYDSTAEHYDKVITCHMGDFIEKNFGNKLKYEVHRIFVPYAASKENVYIEFLSYDTTDPQYKDIYNENVCQLVSDNADNWHKVDSIGEISAAINECNQVEVIVSRAEP